MEKEIIDIESVLDIATTISNEMIKAYYKVAINFRDVGDADQLFSEKVSTFLIENLEITVGPPTGSSNYTVHASFEDKKTAIIQEADRFILRVGAMYQMPSVTKREQFKSFITGNEPGGLSGVMDNIIRGAKNQIGLREILRQKISDDFASDNLDSNTPVVRKQKY